MRKIGFLISSILLSSQLTMAQTQDWKILSKQDVVNYYDVVEAFEAQESTDSISEEEEEGFHRWEVFTRKNMDIHGIYDPKKSSDSFHSFLKGASSSNQRTEAVTNWSLFGPINPPGPTGYNNDGMGRVDVVAFHPTDTNTFYVGSPTGGLWKTTNHGRSWTCLSNSWQSQGVADMAIDKNAPNTLYVATSDRDDHQLRTIGILKSTDGGANWSTIGLSSLYYMCRILLNPKNSKSMLVGTSSGVYKSTDGGLTWNPSSGITSSVDLEYMPGDTSTVIAVTGSGLYKSTDGAKTFSAITTPYSATAYQTNIAVSPASPTTVWVFVADKSYGLEGLYTFSTTSNTFTKIVTGAENVNSPYQSVLGTVKQSLGSQGFYDWVVQVDPINSNRILLGGLDLLQTLDAGKTWYTASYSDIGLGPHVDYHTIMFQPVTNRLFVGSDGGVYRGDISNGPDQPMYSWAEMNEGLSITQEYQIALSVDGKRLLSGSQDNGMHEYAGNPEWNYLQIGDAFDVAIDNYDSTIVYAGLQQGNIYSIVNEDVTQNISDNTKRGETSAFSSKMYSDPNKKHSLYVIYKNLWGTSNAGQSWTNLSSSIGYTNGFDQFGIAPSNSQILYLTGANNLWVSKNAGSSWSAKAFPTTIGYANDIEVNDSNPNIAWLCGASGAISETTDGGATWNSIQYNLPSITIYKILSVSGSTNALLLGTDKGVFFRDNNATTWTLVNNGMPATMVMDLAMNPCNGTLYCATYGRGIWSTSFSGINLAASCCRKGLNVTSQKLALCENQSTTISTSSPLQAGYSYHWFDDSTSLSNSTNSITVSEGGNYSVLVSNSQNTCVSVPAVVGIKNLGPNSPIPHCVDFENGFDSFSDTSAQITAIPFSILTNSNCVNDGNKMLAFKPNAVNSGFGYTHQDAILGSKAFNLNGVLNAAFSFRVAYRNKIYMNSGTKLQVYISTNCGLSYTRIDSIGIDDLANTSTTVDGTWLPSSCGDWKAFSYDISKYAVNNVLFQFKISVLDYPGDVSWGGDLFLDNICLSGIPTGLDDNVLYNDKIQVLPTPSFEVIEIHSTSEIRKVEIMDMLGASVMSVKNQKVIHIEDLTPGQYVLRIETPSGVKTSKIIKQ
jgi:photosystem II stability/assembly factor-like uncharacterized protein